MYFWSAETASPFDHSRSVRPAYFARGCTVVVVGAATVDPAMRAFHTLASVMPVTVRPLACW